MATTQERATRSTKTAANQAADTTSRAAREATERFQEGAKTFQDATERLSSAGNQAFKETVERSLSTLNQLNEVSKANLEAVVASIGAATRGAESIGAQAMSYSKSSVEQGMDAARALSAAKSVQEAVELQTTYARTALETYLAEVNRMSETVAASVKESLAPLNERATAAMETLQSNR